jgi:hypothetical protein
MKYIYKIACLYQIIIWFISGSDYVLGIFDTILPNKDSLSIVISIVIVCFSIFVIWSNIYLLLNKRKGFILKNLHFNKWLNIAQIVNFSVMGLYYNTIIGLHTLVYYMYDTHQTFSFTFGYFKLTMEGGYSKSDTIFVGINLIPLLLFIIFEKRIKAQEENKMIALYKNF